MAKHKVTGIKKDAVIKVEVGGGFYFRISQMLLSYGSTRWPGAELGKVMEHLKDNEPRDEDEYHLLTLLSLVNAIESAAAEQDQIMDEEIDVPDDLLTKPDTPETSPES